jgi:hypothetical protein
MNPSTATMPLTTGQIGHAEGWRNGSSSPFALVPQPLVLHVIDILFRALSAGCGRIANP